ILNTKACALSIIEFLRSIQGLTYATYLLAFIALLQFVALYNTDYTLRLQQRAWIAPRSIAAPENIVSGANEYTEIFIPYENIGSGPSTKMNHQLFATALPTDQFRNETALAKIIKEHLGGKTCDQFYLDKEGRAVFPKTPSGIWIPMEK